MERRDSRTVGRRRQALNRGELHGDIVYRRAALEEILPLRNEVLTPGTDRTTSEYPGDLDEGTRHYGAFQGNVNLACATCLLSHWKDGPAWQLRGMATAPAHRGQGIGSALLAFVERDLQESSDIPGMWCNARIRAVPFYVRLGWTVVSEEFLIPGVGPHKRLVRRLHL